MMTVGSLETGFLTLKEVLEIQKSHPLLTSDENEENILERLEQKLTSGNVVALDLRLGSEVFQSCEKFPKKLDKYNEYISIEPGEFALLSTYESLDMPRNVLAFISMRFQYKQKGLVNVSGFHIDPAYKGKVIYSVYNAGPSQIMLKYKDEIFTIIYARIATETGDRRYSTFQDVKAIKPETISSLMGEPLSLRSLERRVNRLEAWLRALGYGIPIAVAILGVVFALYKTAGVVLNLNP